MTDYCLRKNIIDVDKKEIYRYGFKLIISDIINFSLIIVLGFILGRTIDSIVFLICLCGLRQFTGGFHAKTFWFCRFLMIITYICVMSLVVVISENKCMQVTTVIINTLSFFSIVILAPIENENKPLDRYSKRINKIKSIICSALLGVISVVMVSLKIKLGITISITLLAVMVLMIVALANKKGGKENV